MRSRSLSLGFLVLFGGACSQIIGLGDYENVDAVAGGGGEGPTGGASTNGGSGGQSGRGGNTSGGTNTGADAGAGGISGGEGGGAGTPGSSGSGPEGGVGAQGGVGNAGNGGEGGEAGATGGTSTGGTLGTGGTLNTGGKAGTGGTTGGSPATGGTAGKGGSGGTTGGTTGGAGGKGGSGGTGGSGGKCSPTELLRDGGFDTPSLNAWVDEEIPDTGLVIVSPTADLPTGVTPRSGGYVAWLGGAPSQESWLDQTITLPVGTTQVILTCYYQIYSQETVSTAVDTLDIQLVDSSLSPVYVFGSFSNLDEVGAWTALTRTVNVSAFTGTPAYFELYSATDSTDNTNFFLDSCSLQARCQ